MSKGTPAKKVVIRGYNPATGEYIDVIESNPATTIIIYNKTLTSADTEYSQALPASTKQFFIKLRSQSASCRLAFTSGQATAIGTHIKIPANGFISPSGLNLASTTLYIESPSSGKVAEIIAYV